jgi:predicted membrane-bound spermidine synthase
LRSRVDTRGGAHLTRREAAAPSASGAGGAARRSLGVAGTVALAAFALSGLSALGYEILWTRVLVFFVKSVTYGFSLMLATFLAGLVLGSAIVARFADRRAFARVAFPTIELAAGFVAYGSIRLLVTRAESLRALAPTPGGSLGDLYGPLVFLVVATILPAGILFGATFPLAVRLVTKQASGAAGRVGLATAANTGGAILGAFLGGFVLLPKFGVVGALDVLLAVNVGAAIALAWLLPSRRARLVFGAAALTALAAVLPGRDFFAERLATMRPGRMVFVDEGADVIVTVYEEPPRRG